jgi:hypothetical protein
VLASVAFVLLLGLLFRHILNSPRTRETATGWLERLAEERGGDLDIGSMQWGLLPPRVILSDVALTDTQFAIHVDRLEVELTRLRIARRVIELRTVAASGVRLRLEGKPRTRPRRGDSLFRVVVHHLDLHDVAFEGQDLPGKLDVEIDGADLAWTTERGTPAGFLSMATARLSAPSLETIELSLRSRLLVEEGLRFPAWYLSGEGLSLEGSGSIADGVLRLEATGNVSLDQVAEQIRNPGLLRGTARFSAAVDTGLDEIVQLELTSPQVTAAGFSAADVAARMTIERDQLSGILDSARFHGGRLSGSYRLEHLTGPTRPHRVRVAAEDISLAGLLGNLRVPTGGLAARVGIDGELAWNGRAIERGSGALNARFRRSGGGLPVRGDLELVMTPEGLLRFSADGLEVGGSVVEWQGPLSFGSWQPNWSLRASPAQLAEVATLINSLVGSQVIPSWVSGTGTLLVTLSGPWSDLVVGARLDARPLALPPVVLDQLVTEVTISGSRLALGPTRFRVGEGTGEVDGAVAWGLESGRDQLDLGIRGFRLPVATVADWVGAAGQADGVVSFAGGLRGPLAEPRGSWAVGFDDLTLLGQPLGGGSASVDLADGRFTARALSFEGGLEGTVWLDIADGLIGGHMLWPGMSLAGFGSVVSGLAGGSADLEVDFEVAPGEAVIGRLHADCPNAVVDVTADRDEVTIDATAAESTILETTLNRLGTGALEGGGTLRVEDVTTLIAQLAPGTALPLTGAASASFSVLWPPDGSPTASGTIDSIAFELDGRPVQLLSPSPFQLSARGAELEGIHLAVRSDELFARCTVGADGTLAGNIAGTLDALLLRLALPEWEPAGRATGVVEILGTIDEPRFEGIAEIQQSSFRIPNSRTILSNVDGTVLLSSSEVELDGMDFRFMQGRGRCSGTIGRTDGIIDLALNGTIQDLRYSVLPDLVAQLSGAWRLVGPTDNLEVSGDLTVDSASLRTKDDLPTLVLRWFGGDSVPRPADGGLALDLHIEADETIELRNPSIRLVGSASLDIGGTSNRPGMVGKLEFAEGGEVTLQTLRYEVERATLTFSDPELIEPFIEIQARTFVQNYDITLRLTGTPQRLVPSVSSNPPLTEDEIYGLMAFGYRSDAATAGAMGIGLASSILSQQLAQELDRRAGLALPVDQVRVDPFAETSTGDPGAARITVVKQLSPAWTVTVQSNLSGEREEVVVSRWYLAPGIFVEASRDLDGTYGIDLKVRRQY